MTSSFTETSAVDNKINNDANMPNSTSATNQNFASESSRLAAINKIIGTKRLSQSPLAQVIAPLLVALDWFGAPNQLLACMPDEKTPLEINDLAKILADQGFNLQRKNYSQWRSSHGVEHLPTGSIIVSDNEALVFLGCQGDELWWHDGKTAVKKLLPEQDVELLLIEKDASFQSLDAPQKKWLNKIFGSAKREINGVILISLITNILALAISLFTMFVYNVVIPTGAVDSLWAIASGALIVVLGAWALRLARVKLITRMTGWAGARISNMAMRKTLGLPAEVSTRLGVENNLIRLRSLEGVRQWFGGAGGAINIDYPFMVIFLFVIALLGGWIVLVPLISILVFILISWPISNLINARASHVSQISRKLGELTSVVTHRLRALRGVRGSALWEKRISELVAQSIVANRDYALANSFAQTLGQAFSMFTVLATMAVGISLVLSGTMNTGGLIATMMLIWRVTTPLQQMFANQIRVKQLIDSTRQLNRLLASSGEASNPQFVSPVTSLSPTVDADRIYYRYSADHEPALSGISFNVEPGSVVAVVGPNGSGKTTLLKTLAGIKQPQNGRVIVGGKDIRQFDPADYRAWLGYLPQSLPGLPITVREALLLHRPEASDQAIMEALALVAGEQWWSLLGASSATSALDLNFLPWRSDRQATRGRYIIRLSAAILGRPSLLLLDDPLGDCDPALDPLLISLINKLRGQCTIILATHRPDLIQCADLIAVLNEGALAHFGPVTPPTDTPLNDTPEQANSSENN